MNKSCCADARRCRGRWRLAGAVALGLLLLPGCRQAAPQPSAGPVALATQASRPDQASGAPTEGQAASPIPAAVATAGGAEEVKMTVLHAQGGQALALVPVFLDGHGPYSFALDTGASKSTVDQKVAADLRLPVEGKSVPVSGAVANAEATLVRVQTWRVGDLPLPSRQLLTADLAALHREVGIQGLLGSDVLSRFDAVTIDYRGQRLLFQPHR